MLTAPLPEYQVRTPRMVLRPLKETDRGEFVRAHHESAAHFAPWLPLRPAGQTDDGFFEESLKRTREGLARGESVRLGAFLEDGRMAGLLALNQIFRGPLESAHMGWRVSVDCVGRGLGTEAVRAMLDLSFAPLPRGVGLHRVQANVMPRNGPSLRLAEKCGFRREGVALKYLKIAGAWEDHVMFAMVAEEHGHEG